MEGTCQAGKANFNYGDANQRTNLFVAALIWENTASLPGNPQNSGNPIPMTHISSGVYVGQFVFAAGKLYTIIKKIYTDGTYATPAPGESVDEENVQCLDFFQQSTKIVGVEIDFTLQQNSADFDIGKNEADFDIPKFEFDLTIEC